MYDGHGQGLPVAAWVGNWRQEVRGTRKEVWQRLTVMPCHILCVMYDVCVSSAPLSNLEPTFSTWGWCATQADYALMWES